MTQLGKRPGDPWECGRCCSEGSRAVLCDDRRPGCHVCRHVTGIWRLFDLMLRHCYSSPAFLACLSVETPFKVMFPGAPILTPPRQWIVAIDPP
jgi:hypothetical protein